MYQDDDDDDYVLLGFSAVYSHRQMACTRRIGSQQLYHRPYLREGLKSQCAKSYTVIRCLVHLMTTRHCFVNLLLRQSVKDSALCSGVSPFVSATR
jgi:hypothetical protein